MSTYGRRRALGQHFLKDSEVAKSIAEAGVQQAVAHSCSALLEIGPGKGAITHPLLELLPEYPQIKNFILAERDLFFAAQWQTHSLSKRSPALSFSVEAGDFLELPKEKWLFSLPLAVVSNLPYSAGTAILQRLVQNRDSIPVMVLMFQAEVAQRLRAEPSTKGRGSLSLWVQNLWDIQKLLSVPPAAFIPPPQVNSEVVVLKRRESPRVPHTLEESKLWESLLKICFAHRRKMLRSVIPWKNTLELSGVNGTKRAEELGWEEWDRLFQTVRQVSGSQSS